MYFSQPFWLLGWLILPVFVWLEKRWGRWRQQALAAWREERHEPLNEGGGDFALWMGCWFLLVLSLARPQGFPSPVESGPGRLALVWAVDLSKSMRVSDATISRLEAAKRLIRAWLPALPRDRVGLVGFAGAARTFCPLTLDHPALEMALNRMEAGNEPMQGTNLAAGIQAATRKLSAAPDTAMKIMIVLSDGETPQELDKLRLAVLEARANRIHLCAVGIGTIPGGFIPLGKDFWGKPIYQRYRGERVISRLCPEKLELLAALGQGTYAGLSDFLPGGRDPILDFVAERRNQARSLNQKIQYRELYAWPLCLALVLWLAEMARFGGRREKFGAWGRRNPVPGQGAR